MLYACSISDQRGSAILIIDSWPAVPKILIVFVEIMANYVNWENVEFFVFLSFVGPEISTNAADCNALRQLVSDHHTHHDQSQGQEAIPNPWPSGGGR